MTKVLWFWDAVGPFRKHRAWPAFTRGFQAVGDKVIWHKTTTPGVPCDVIACCSGPKSPPYNEDRLTTARVIIRENYDKRIILESPTFRRGAGPVYDGIYWRMAWNGFLRDEANYNNRDCSPDRWHKIKRSQGIEIKPWQLDRKGYVLLMLQREGDASMRGVDINEWGSERIDEIQEHTTSPIRVRLHPEHRGPVFESSRAEVSDDFAPGGLWRDFAGARAVVTFNSLSAVESVCEGIPTWTLNPGSMAWPVAHHDLKDLDNPREFERDQWLANLGYTQWTLKELAKGTAWKHLKSVHF